MTCVLSENSDDLEFRKVLIQRNEEGALAGYLKPAPDPVQGSRHARRYIVSLIHKNSLHLTQSSSNCSFGSETLSLYVVF